MRLNCACYCKDTHFEAIHNDVYDSVFAVTIVLATAKIHILKQFTTFRLKSDVSFNCACYCKDTHFEAIHNYVDAAEPHDNIVLATAKIHILKQFTTFTLFIVVFYHCACYCKDTHFEAIHNARPAGDYRAGIVLATAKIHILKQFTTITSMKPSPN